MDTRDQAIAEAYEKGRIYRQQRAAKLATMPPKVNNGEVPPTNDDNEENEEEFQEVIDFDKFDGTDQKDAQSKVSGLKIPWDPEDIKFWFSQLENHLENAGVHSQWTKRMVLQKQLDPSVQADCKDLLQKKKSEAGATPYFDLKSQLFDIYGPQPEDGFYQAEALRLTAKPSQLAKRIISSLCPAHTTLPPGCCMEGVVSALWRRQLPKDVRAAVAGMRLSATELNNTLRIADAVFSATRSATPQVVAAVTTQPAPEPASQPGPPPQPLDTSADEPALQVAAYAYRPRGQPHRGAYRGGRQTFRGSYRGQPQPQPQPQRFRPPAPRPQYQPHPYQQPAIQPTRGPRHPDNPPMSACNIHWKYGRSATSCRQPTTCPWKHVLAQPNYYY